MINRMPLADEAPRRVILLAYLLKREACTLVIARTRIDLPGALP